MVARWTRVFWSDLSGYVVRTPGAADAPKEKARQKASREEQAKTGELLPDTPISLPRIRAADLDVQYKVAKIESDKMPVDSLDAHLLMEDGFISVKPLKLGVGNGSRSEEHTSELQSLMRLSYAVFCLKKKKINSKTNEM